MQLSDLCKCRYFVPIPIPTPNTCKQKKNPSDLVEIGDQISLNTRLFNHCETVMKKTIQLMRVLCSSQHLQEVEKNCCPSAKKYKKTQKREDILHFPYAKSI